MAVHGHSDAIVAHPRPSLPTRLTIHSASLQQQVLRSHARDAVCARISAANAYGSARPLLGRLELPARDGPERNSRYWESGAEMQTLHLKCKTVRGLRSSNAGSIAVYSQAQFRNRVGRMDLT